MIYYHHKTIKKTTSALLELFNDIHVQEFDDNDNVTRDTVIPIRFASSQKPFELNEDDFENLRKSQFNILPRLSLSFDGLSKTQEKDTNNLNKVASSVTVGDLKWTYNSVSYDANFTLNILAKTFTDITVLVEQIIPMFNPTYPLKFKDLDFHDEHRTMLISLNDVSFDLDVDLDLDSDVRFTNATLNLTVPVTFYPPIKESKLINTIEHSLKA